MNEEDTWAIIKFRRACGSNMPRSSPVQFSGWEYVLRCSTSCGRSLSRFCFKLEMEFFRCFPIIASGYFSFSTRLQSLKCWILQLMPFPFKSTSPVISDNIYYGIDIIISTKSSIMIIGPSFSDTWSERGAINWIF